MPLGSATPSNSSRASPEARRVITVASRTGTPSSSRRCTSTSTRFAAGPAATAPAPASRSQSEPPASRRGRATRAPFNVRSTRPVSTGMRRPGGGALHTKRPLRVCVPRGRRTLGAPPCSITLAALAPTRTSSGHAPLAPPGSATSVSIAANTSCSNVPPFAPSVSESRPGQTQARCPLATKNGQVSASWPRSTQSIHGRSGSGTSSRASGSAPAAAASIRENAKANSARIASPRGS